VKIKNYKLINTGVLLAALATCWVGLSPADAQTATQEPRQVDSQTPKTSDNSQEPKAGAQIPATRKMRRCMAAKLPDGVAAVQAHMRAFRTSNPNATPLEIRMERHHAVQAWQQGHETEFEAARQACS
jgi:hypothetical protein